MEKPKGKLIPIGGKEARASENSSEKKRPVTFTNEGVLSEVLEEMKGPDSKVVVITTASQEPEEMGEMYIEAFSKLGCEGVKSLHLDGRNVDAKKNLDLLAAADGVFFTGGDQLRLTEKLCNTRFMDLLMERYYEEDFVVAGTSAGAMAMSALMIKDGSNTESLLKGIVQIDKGFNLLPNTIIDTHFMSRGRFSRLAEAILGHGGHTAVGICEDTGLVISEGNLLRTIGSGVAFIIQADHVRETNFKKARKMEAVFVEGLGVHILARGASYALKEKRFLVDKASPS